MFWTLRRWILDIPYQIRSRMFHIRHGFAQEDVWSLNDAIAQWLVPRLRYLAENHTSYPGGEIDDESWTVILNKMIDAFEIIRDDAWDIDEKRVHVEEGLDLFRKYFFHLWD